MFKEIRRSERILEEDRKERESKAFMEIKPQTGMTVDDAQAFWTNLFAMDMN